MIELYTWNTSNGRKVSIALEEMGFAFSARPVDISRGEQFRPGFLKISPNAKIPAIIDHEDGVQLFESGAILMHLAEKSGKFLTYSGPARSNALKWLMWQMGGFGPMLGQAAHFLHYNPDASAYAANRFHVEARRLYSVLDMQLAGNEFVAGEYSIADMAIWPWVTRFAWQRIEPNQYPNIDRWYRMISARPAVRKGFDALGTGEQIPAFAQSE